jgi:hypothetical protein
MPRIIYKIIDYLINPVSENLQNLLHLLSDQRYNHLEHINDTLSRIRQIFGNKYNYLKQVAVLKLNTSSDLKKEPGHIYSCEYKNDKLFNDLKEIIDSIKTFEIFSELYSICQSDNQQETHQITALFDSMINPKPLMVDVGVQFKGERQFTNTALQHEPQSPLQKRSKINETNKLETTQNSSRKQQPQKTKDENSVLPQIRSSASSSEAKKTEPLRESSNNVIKSTNIKLEPDPVNITDQSLDELRYHSQDIHEFSTFTRSEETEVRSYTKKERFYLVKGYLLYRTMHTKWRIILDNFSDHFPGRTNVNLKDLFRTIQSNGKLELISKLFEDGDVEWKDEFNDLMI